MVSLNPIRIMKNNADEEKAEVARLSSFVGAMAIGDLVKSTLGPKGMDKILWVGLLPSSCKAKSHLYCGPSALQLAFFMGYG